MFFGGLITCSVYFFYAVGETSLDETCIYNSLTIPRFVADTHGDFCVSWEKFSTSPTDDLYSGGLVVGKLSDTVGRKVILTVSLSALLLATLGCVLSYNKWQFLFFRSLTGKFCILLLTEKCVYDLSEINADFRFQA